MLSALPEISRCFITCQSSCLPPLTPRYVWNLVNSLINNILRLFLEIFYATREITFISSSPVCGLRLYTLSLNFHTDNTRRYRLGEKQATKIINFSVTRIVLNAETVLFPVRATALSW